MTFEQTAIKRSEIKAFLWSDTGLGFDDNEYQATKWQITKQLYDQISQQAHWEISDKTWDRYFELEQRTTDDL